MGATKEDLFEAAAAGDLELLKKNPQGLTEKNERGWTLLHFAARYGQLPIVEYLLTTSCDLSAVNVEGKTAEEVAVFWGFDKIAQLIRVAKAGNTGNREGHDARFPPNRTNFFAGSPLNRYSWPRLQYMHMTACLQVCFPLLVLGYLRYGWYRSEYHKLRGIARSERSRYILLKELNPLFDASGLYFAKYTEVATIVNKVYPDAKPEVTKPVPEGDEIILVFLGIDERDGKGEHGTAYWALDMTPRGTHEEEFNKLNEGTRREKRANSTMR